MNPEQMRSKCRLAVCAFVLCSAPVAAVVPPLDTAVTPATRSCGRDPSTGRILRLRHFGHIIFVVTQPLFAANDADQAALSQLPLQSELAIKVADNPRQVADLKGKVLRFLAASDVAQNRQRVQIVDVSYAAVCTR
ncbi:MAG: hypothetical protein ACT4QB_20300 [Gammaproteobacteria bacterium]